MSARPYRLLALVKQDAVVRVQKEPDDTVMTWPHLLTIEFLAAGMMSIFLLLMGLFINAPLEELANGNVTPAVAKAPWYFLGLQELLAYFHPTVAGVLVPTFVLVGAALIPYVDRANILAIRPSRAEDRGRAVHAVLHPRPDADVRRHLLPGPGLHVRHPVRDRPRRPLRPVTRFPKGPRRDEQLPRRTGRQARRPDQGGDQVAAQGAGPGHLAPAADAHRARGRASACGCSRSRAGHDRLHLAEPDGRLRGADRDRHARDRQGPELDPARSSEGFPAYYPEARAFVILVDPGQQRVPAGRGHDRRRHRRSTSARSTSAARTSAASRTRARRTSGSSARATGRATTGSGSRPTAPQYGPAPRGMDRFSITVEQRRQPDHQHRQDHPRPAARSRSASPGSSRRARPTGCI